jgi:hypothetical protein
VPGYNVGGFNSPTCPDKGNEQLSAWRTQPVEPNIEVGNKNVDRTVIHGVTPRQLAS